MTVLLLSAASAPPPSARTGMAAAAGGPPRSAGLWSTADVKVPAPSVVSSGLLPSASLSSPAFYYHGSGGSGGGIAHIPLSFARRQLSSASSEAAGHRLTQQALVAQLTSAFVSWQQQTVNEYGHILRQHTRDAHNRMAAAASRSKEAMPHATSDAVKRDRPEPSVDPRTEQQQQQSQQQRRGSLSASLRAVNATVDQRETAGDGSAAAGEVHSGLVADQPPPSDASAQSGNSPHAATDSALFAEMAAAEAAQTSATAQYDEAEQAAQRAAAEMGLHRLPPDCHSPLQSLHSVLSPWLTTRVNLAARVQAIKQTQAALQAEKTRLTAWKDRLKQQQQSGEHSASERLADDSRQWEAAKQKLAADGGRLKEEHADYERRIAEYKAEEATIKQQWAAIGRMVNGDTQSSDTSPHSRPLPAADNLSALIGGLERLQQASKQRADAVQRLSAVAAHQQQLQQQQQGAAQLRESPRTRSEVAEALATSTDHGRHSAKGEHMSSQPSNGDTMAALAVAGRQIAEQRRQLTELTRQLAEARQREADNSTNTPQPTERAPTEQNGVAATGDAANELLRIKPSTPLQPSSSLVPTSRSSSSPPCSSCDALLARCSSLEASLSQCAADLSAATALLSSERDRHASLECEWRQQQTAHSASLVGASGAAEAETARYVRLASERQVQLEDLSRLLDETVRKGNREVNESRTSQQRAMEEAVGTLERQQAIERQQWVQQLEASMAAAGEQTEAREAVEERLAEECRKSRETDAQLAAQRLAFAALQAEASEALQTRDGLLAQLASATADIARLHGVVDAERQKAAEAEAERAATFERMLEEQKRRKEFQFKYEDAKGKVRVYARVRPFTAAEVAAREKTLLRPGRNEWTLELNETQRDVLGNISDKWREFAFDHVFHAGLLPSTKGNGSQAEVFEETAAFAELSLQGINCCVFAYGQSGTGRRAADHQR